MPTPISCSCTPPPRKFTYGSSQPLDVTDARTSIGYREYYQDQTVTDIDVPYCKTVGNEAFRESSVTGFYAPECITIGESAFRNCPDLCNLDLPSVKTIGAYAFADSLKDVQQDVYMTLSSIETIGSHGFDGCRMDMANKVIYLDITNIKELGDSALSGCGDFLYYPYYTDDASKMVYLPNCEKIGGYCFYTGYSNYTCNAHSIILPAIKTIGERAFSHVSFREGTADNCCSLVMGPNCTTIGDRIVNDIWGSGESTQYVDIYCYATTPPTLQGPFSYAWMTWWDPHCIYVPAGSVDAYKAAANWSSYASLITAMPQDHQTIDTWLL